MKKQFLIFTFFLTMNSNVNSMLSRLPTITSRSLLSYQLMQRNLLINSNRRFCTSQFYLRKPEKRIRRVYTTYGEKTFAVNEKGQQVILDPKIGSWAEIKSSVKDPHTQKRFYKFVQLDQNGNIIGTHYELVN